MPRKEIDYSNTIIYKLCCKNPEIKDIYVGHTTDFTKRKYQHKSCCNNSSLKNYNINVYKFIRDNGGWNNFDMVMIEQHSCENKLEAHKRERYWLETLNATLNIQIPSRTDEEYDKNYRKKNREYIVERKKKYYDENKERFIEQKKKYYENNKKKINERRNKKIVCECGCEITRGNILAHQQTNKHLEAMKLKTES